MTINSCTSVEVYFAKIVELHKYLLSSDAFVSITFIVILGRLRNDNGNSIDNVKN